MYKSTVAGGVLCAVFIGGCAFDVIKVEQIPARLVAEQSCAHAFELSKPVDVTPIGGYPRTLQPGTNWYCNGRIEQGNVYATKDQIVTVEASNIFEAHIVISSNQMVGFYLPVEKTFSPIENSTPLAMVDIDLPNSGHPQE